MAMALLRAAAVALVAFLLLRPVWVTEDKTQKSRVVAVLIDASQSMGTPDPRPNPPDQWRAAMAYGLADITAGLPDDPSGSGIAGIRDKLPERPDDGPRGRAAITRPQRVEVARAALTNPKVNLLPRLTTVGGALEVYTFGSSRTGRDPTSDDWLKTLAATESRTALTASALELLNRDDADLPAAIVLVTDGRENVGPRTLQQLGEACKKRGVPVYAYGVGSSAFGQLQAAFGAAAADKEAAGKAGADVDVPNTLFVDDTAAVPVRYTIKGVAEGTARVVLKYGGREVASESHPFALTPAEMRDGKTFSRVLRFVPIKEDAEAKRQEFTAVVTVTSGTAAETLAQELSRPARVLDRKLKVLVLDGLPRRDFQYLQRDLLRDRRVEARFFLTEGDKAAMRSGPPWMIDLTRELNGTLNLTKEDFRQLVMGFDLIVLGDVPGKFLAHGPMSAEHQEVIRDFVADGGGLIHVAGRWHGPAEWAGEWGKTKDGKPVPTRPPTPLGELLPVEFDARRFPVQALDNPAPFVPVLGPAAARTPVVTLEDDPLDNAELWGKPGNAGGEPANEKQLRPLYWFYPVLKAKPAADVFLVHPTARTPAPDDKPMPLLAGHYYGKGYVLYVGFDDTWRWRFNLQNKYSGKFWAQAVYAAGIPRMVGTRQTQLTTSSPAPTVGTSGTVFLRAYDEKFRPLVADEIEGTLEKVKVTPEDEGWTRPVKFTRVDGAEGEYRADLAFTEAGQFRLEVDPTGGKTPAALNLPVSYPEDHERAARPMDEDGLRRLCETTGGKFYREEDLAKLPDAVRPQVATLTTRREVLLWNQWAMLLLVGLLTAEWLLRKFNGLS
jgi:hypothetical protein